MWYNGGKIRISKRIAPILQESADKTGKFADLFCGGCNIIDKISANERIANDIHYELISMWEKLRDGWIPERLEYNKEFYNEVKDNRNNYYPEIVGLVGFHYSYGGKYFGGYAKSRYEDHIERSINKTVQQAELLKDVRFYNKDYQEFSNLKGWTIYCDPPYIKSTQKSTRYGVEFDHDEFWNWCRKISKENDVFISEKESPDDFEKIWEHAHNSNMQYNGTKKTSEKLFKIT